MTLRSGGIGASSRFSWRKVCTGVKCNFSSPHHHVRKIVGKLSIRRVRMWNFTRIGPKTKKLWLSIVSARRPSEHTSLGPPQKGVNCNFSWPEFDKLYGVRNLSISDAWICSFSKIAQKIKNYSSFNFLPENLEKFGSTELSQTIKISALLIFCLKTSKNFVRLSFMVRL